MITEAIAIELTKSLLINGQDEKPIEYGLFFDKTAYVVLSDLRELHFNRVEVEHAKLMLKKGEKNES
jgi:competence protein ComGF